MYNVISDKLNDLCPIKKKYVRDSNEPWLTNDIIDLIYTKNSAWKRAKKTMILMISERPKYYVIGSRMSFREPRPALYRTICIMIMCQ